MSTTSPSRLRVAGTFFVAALGVAGLTACQPIQPAADLTIAATATSAEPAPPASPTCGRESSTSQPSSMRPPWKVQPRTDP